MDRDRDREHPTPERLQRYFDGELAPDDPNDLEAHVASCPECSAQEASLTRLRGWLTMAAADDAKHVDSERLFAAIERGIAAEADDFTPEPVVAAPRVKPVPPRRLRLLRNIAPYGGALALAAAVLLMVYQPDNQPGDNNEDSYELAQGHSEVVEVDFGSNAGTVFDIPLSDGSSTPVVWIDDDDEDEE